MAKALPIITPEQERDWLVSKLRHACYNLGIPLPEGRALNARELMRKIKAAAAAEMVAIIEKELGLAYRSDGTPYQDPAKEPYWTPRNLNFKYAILTNWPCYLVPTR